MRWQLLLVGTGLLPIAVASSAQTPATFCAAMHGRPLTAEEVVNRWHDASPHHERKLALGATKNIALEVLDWGGNGGMPVVWLPGARGTAHVFDDVAPRLKSVGRQIGITPRGQWPSSAPDSGYDLDTRVADVIAVMDSLRIPRAVFVGHSIAGDILTGLSQQYPARVAGLVYVDAAYDRSLDPPLVPADIVRAGHPPRASSPSEALAVVCDEEHWPAAAEITESIRQIRELGQGTPSLKQLAEHGNEAARRERVMRESAAGMWPGGRLAKEPKAPVVLMYARRGTRAKTVFELGLTERDALKRFDDWWNTEKQPLLDKQRAAAAANWPTARIVLLDSATHTMMWSNPDAVIRAVRDAVRGARP